MRADQAECLTRTWNGLEAAPDGRAWALVETPAYPSWDEANPAAVAWRDLHVDPDLAGVEPSRTRGAVRIGVADATPWAPPVGRQPARLAWHPGRPLVAGLTRCGRHAHPWVADYAARTFTTHVNVRAALSLTALDPYRRAPLAWGADGELLLPVAGRRLPEPQAAPPCARAYEAVGPGHVDFMPDAVELTALAAAPVVALDPERGTTRSLTGPSLVRALSPSGDGGLLLVEYADERPPDADEAPAHGEDALRWRTAVIDAREGRRLATVDATDVRWARGGDGTYAWRTADGRVRFCSPGQGYAELAPPDGVLAWWPLRHQGENAVLSHHRGGRGPELAVTTSAGIRRHPIPGVALLPALVVPPDAAPQRAVLTCLGTPGTAETSAPGTAGGGAGPCAGVVVVELFTGGVTVAWAPAADVTGAWPVGHEDGAGLLTYGPDGVRRFRLDGETLREQAVAPDRDAAPRRGPPVPSGPRRFDIATGFATATLGLTGPPPGDGPAPVLLWLGPRNADLPGRAIHLDVPGAVPEALLLGGDPFAHLDLPLHWPGDATVAMLHEQITGPVRTALKLIARQGHGPVIAGGHSFGATLALYALAHVPEIAGAIAHSGCYNRTLTPTGFQYERRAYWTVPEIYHAFGALTFADRLTRPVLLLHGERDANPATGPEHAVDLYRAIVATGGHARLVMLPGEGHTFRYLESQQTVIDEHRDWLLRARTDRAGSGASGS
jgi:dienelactone hydrolase